MLLLCLGCSQPWDRVSSGTEGRIVAPADNRTGQDLARGLVLGWETGEAITGHGARFLKIGQPVRVVKDGTSSPVDDRGRRIEVLILDGPHNGLHAMIRRDQFTPRSTP